MHFNLKTAKTSLFKFRDVRLLGSMQKINLEHLSNMGNKTAGLHRNILCQTTNILNKFCKRLKTKLLF